MKLSTIVSYGAGTAGLSFLWVAAVAAAPGDAPALLVAVGPVALVGLSGLSLALVAVARPDRRVPHRPYERAEVEVVTRR